MKLKLSTLITVVLELLEKIRPITKNVKSVINDIEKLKRTRYENKVVLFIVFPLLPERSMGTWNKHLSKIRSNLRNFWSYRVKFRNGIPGVIYLGQFSNK